MLIKRYNQLIHQTDQYYHCGEFKSAKKSNLKAKLMAPWHHRNYLNSGIFCLREHKTKRAYLNFTIASLLDKKDHSAFNHMGLMHYNESKWKQAEKCFNKAVKRNPESSNLHLNMGITLNALDRENEAISQLNTAITLNNNAQAFFHLGCIYEAKGYLSKAKENYEKLLENSENLDDDKLVYLSLEALNKIKDYTNSVIKNELPKVSTLKQKTKRI